MAEEDGNDGLLMAEVTRRGEEVRGMLAKKDKKGALAKALESPPITAKSAQVKEANAKNVEACLSQISDIEMGGVIETLNDEACDTFMKYIYYFMENNFNCGSMLKAHALLSAKSGMGSIVRTLTDRKSVW